MAITRERRYELQERHRQRNFCRVIEYLKDHPCADCGETDMVVLDFDHLPGTSKRFDVARAVSGSTRSWESIQAEIDKCDVVRANCHRRRTAMRAGHRKHLLDAGSQLAVPPPLSRFRVPHGGGSKGRTNCGCELCIAKRREYARQLARTEAARRASPDRPPPPGTLKK